MRLEDKKNFHPNANNNLGGDNQDEDYEGPNTNVYYIADIEYEKWTFLVFSHKPSGFLQKSEFQVI